ncbi:MAG: DNA cytosine methyltransferase, partial [Synergistales bacterium]|nr:DNA cytosine methyltransferase [Synergistales bacterium]
IQPWQFGHGECKKTCLWLKNLPLLQPTHIVEGREQRIWKASPGPERWKERSRTYAGIAQAMAEQWF